MYGLRVPPGEKNTPAQWIHDRKIYGSDASRPRPAGRGREVRGINPSTTYVRRNDSRVRQSGSRMRRSGSRTRRNSSRMRRNDSRVRQSGSRMPRNDSRVRRKSSRVPLKNSRVRRNDSRVRPNSSRLRRNDFRMPLNNFRVPRKVSCLLLNDLTLVGYGPGRGTSPISLPLVPMLCVRCSVEALPLTPLCSGDTPRRRQSGKTGMPRQSQECSRPLRNDARLPPNKSRLLSLQQRLKPLIITNSLWPVI
jgi:hypothetical protein